MIFTFSVYCLLSGLIVQVIYLLVTQYGISKIKERQTLTNPQPVSVIVCAHDEEQNLKDLLPALFKQQHDCFEVIVVDDRSNDNTYDYLLNLSHHEPRLKIVRVESIPDHVNSKKYALTLGIKAASHDIILLTDADCKPLTSNWISHMAAHFNDEHTSFVLGSSPYYKEKSLLNAFIRFESWLTAFMYAGFAGLGRPYMGVGRNLAYRKCVFLANKGFNKQISVKGGDDDLLVNRLSNSKNTEVCIHPEAIVYSKPKASWGSFFRQKRRHLSVGKLYKFSDRMVLAGFSLSMVCFWLGLIWTLADGLPLILIIAAYLLRLMVLSWVSYKSSRRLGHQINTWLVSFLDFIYLFYYLFTGSVALITKKVSWS